MNPRDFVIQLFIVLSIVLLVSVLSIKYVYRLDTYNKECTFISLFAIFFLGLATIPYFQHLLFEL